MSVAVPKPKPAPKGRAKKLKPKVSVAETRMMKAFLKVIQKTVKEEGYMTIQPDALPEIEYTPQTVSPITDSASALTTVLLNYAMQRAGAAVKNSEISGFSFALIRTYLQNVLYRAMRDEKVEPQYLPNWINYFLACIGSKRGEIREGKGIAYSWLAGSVPPNIPDGSAVTLYSLGHTYTSSLFGAAVLGPNVTWGTPTTASQAAVGGFCTIPTVVTPYSSDAAAAEWEEFSQLLSSDFFKSTGKVNLGLDPSGVVDAYAKISDDVFSSLAVSTGGSVYAFLSEDKMNSDAVDFRILQTKTAFPATAAVPDPRKLPVSVSLSGGPAVGFSALQWAGQAKNPAQLIKTVLRPAPYDIGDLSNRFFKILGKALLNKYGPALVGLPADFFNTTELWLLFVNFMLPAFQGNSAFSATVFPTPGVRPNYRSLNVDTKNFPTENSQAIPFAANFKEVVGQMPHAVIKDFPGRKGVTIMTLPVLVGDNTTEYDVLIQDTLVSAGLGLGPVAVTFPIAPAVAYPAFDRPWGRVDVFTGMWAPTVPSVTAQAINYTNGGVMQSVYDRFSNLMAQLSTNLRIDSGLLTSEATRNRVLMIKDEGEDDVKVVTGSGNIDIDVRLLCEKPPKTVAADLGDPGLQLQYELDGIVPSIYAGDAVSFGTTAIPFTVTSVAAEFGFKCFAAMGDTSEESMAVKCATIMAAAPMQGLDGSVLGTSEFVKIFEHRGGGYFWDDGQKKSIEDLIAKAPPELSGIIEVLKDKKFGAAVIKRVTNSGDVTKALDILRRGMKTREGLAKVGTFLRDNLKKIAETAFDAIIKGF